MSFTPWWEYDQEGNKITSEREQYKSSLEQADVDLTPMDMENLYVRSALNSDSAYRALADDGKKDVTTRYNSLSSWEKLQTTSRMFGTFNAADEVHDLSQARQMNIQSDVPLESILTGVPLQHREMVQSEYEQYGVAAAMVKRDQLMLDVVDGRAFDEMSLGAQLLYGGAAFIVDPATLVPGYMIAGAAGKLAFKANSIKKAMQASAPFQGAFKQTFTSIAASQGVARATNLAKWTTMGAVEGVFANLPRLAQDHTYNAKEYYLDVAMDAAFGGALPIAWHGMLKPTGKYMFGKTEVKATRQRNAEEVVEVLDEFQKKDNQSRATTGKPLSPYAPEAENPREVINLDDEQAVVEGTDTVGTTAAVFTANNAIKPVLHNYDLIEGVNIEISPLHNEPYRKPWTMLTAGGEPKAKEAYDKLSPDDKQLYNVYDELDASWDIEFKLSKQAQALRKKQPKGSIYRDHFKTEKEFQAARAEQSARIDEITELELQSERETLNRRSLYKELDELKRMYAQLDNPSGFATELFESRKFDLVGERKKLSDKNTQVTSFYDVKSVDYEGWSQLYNKVKALFKDGTPVDWLLYRTNQLNQMAVGNVERELVDQINAEVLKVVYQFPDGKIPKGHEQRIDNLMFGQARWATNTLIENMMNGHITVENTGKYLKHILNQEGLDLNELTPVSAAEFMRAHAPVLTPPEESVLVKGLDDWENSVDEMDVDYGMNSSGDDITAPAIMQMDLNISGGLLPETSFLRDMIEINRQAMNADSLDSNAIAQLELINGIVNQRAAQLQLRSKSKKELELPERKPEYSKMTVVELKDLLREAKKTDPSVRVGGHKMLLVARMENVWTKQQEAKLKIDEQNVVRMPENVSPEGHRIIRELTESETAEDKFKKSLNVSNRLPASEQIMAVDIKRILKEQGIESILPEYRAAWEELKAQGLSNKDIAKELHKQKIPKVNPAYKQAAASLRARGRIGLKDEVRDVGKENTRKTNTSQKADTSQDKSEIGQSTNIETFNDTPMMSETAEGDFSSWDFVERVDSGLLPRSKREAINFDLFETDEEVGGLVNVNDTTLEVFLENIKHRFTNKATKQHLRNKELQKARVEYMHSTFTNMKLRPKETISGALNNSTATEVLDVIAASQEITRKAQAEQRAAKENHGRTDEREARRIAHIKAEVHHEYAPQIRGIRQRQNEVRMKLVTLMKKFTNSAEMLYHVNRSKVLDFEMGAIMDKGKFNSDELKAVSREQQEHLSAITKLREDFPKAEYDKLAYEAEALQVELDLTLQERKKVARMREHDATYSPSRLQDIEKKERIAKGVEEKLGKAKHAMNTPSPQQQANMAQQASKPDTPRDQSVVLSPAVKVDDPVTVPKEEPKPKGDDDTTPPPPPPPVPPALTEELVEQLSEGNLPEQLSLDEITALQEVVVQADNQLVLDKVEQGVEELRKFQESGESAAVDLAKKAKHALDYAGRLLSRLTRDTAETFMNSPLESLKYFGSKVPEFGRGFAGAMKRAASGAIWRDKSYKESIAQIAKPYVDAIEAFAMEQGLGTIRTMRAQNRSGEFNKLTDQFNKQVFHIIEYQRQGKPMPTTISPTTRKFVEQWDKYMDRNFDQLIDGNVAGFTAKRKVRHYIPHIWKPNKMRHAINTHGVEKVRHLFTQAYMRSSVANYNEADAAKAADNLIEWVSSQNAGNEVDQFIPGVDSRAHHRKDLDTTTEVDGLSVLDIMDSDVIGIAQKYSNRLAGWVGLSKSTNGWLNNDRGLMTLRNAIQAEAKQKGISKSKTDKHLQQFDDIIDQMFGRPLRTFKQGSLMDKIATKLNDGDVHKGLPMEIRQLKDLTALTRMGGLGSAQFIETGQVLVRNVMNLYSDPEVFRRTMVMAGEDPSDKGIMAEIQALSGISDDIEWFDRQSVHLDQQELNEVSLIRQASLKIADMATGGEMKAEASRLLGKITLHNVTRKYQQRLTQASFVLDIAKHFHNGTGKMSNARMADLGLTDVDGVDAGFSQLFNSGVVKFDANGHVTALNADKWPKDLREKFQLAMIRSEAQEISRAHIGELPTWMNRPLMQLIFQFRRIPLLNTNKQLARNLAFADTEGAVSVMMNAVMAGTVRGAKFAGLGYTGAAIAGEDWSEPYGGDTERWFTDSAQYMAQTGIFADAYDLVLGPHQVNYDTWEGAARSVVDQIPVAGLLKDYYDAADHGHKGEIEQAIHAADNTVMLQNTYVGEVIHDALQRLHDELGD